MSDVTNIRAPVSPYERPVLVPQTFDQLVMFAEMAAQSELVPKDYRGKPANIMIAVQMGSELGLPPMQAIQSIAVINGRPGVWGDGLIGLCRQSPLCEDIAEHIEGDGDQRTAVCVAKRRGKTPVVGRFSVADAKRAELWNKAGPWKQYPDRMLKNRARGFALRDAFPDVLRGLKTAEELHDTPPDAFRGTTLDAAPEPVRAPPAPRPASPQESTPEAPKRRTARQWLDDLKVALDAAPDRAAVDAIVTGPDVTKALGWLKDAGLTELHDLIGAALDRVAAAEIEPETPAEPAPEVKPEPVPDEEIFPGDR